MADIDSTLTIHDLQRELVVRELIEKTKAFGLTWASLGGNQFTSSNVVGSVTWEFYISKTQIGSLTYRYNLDIKKNSVSYISITDGALPSSARDSQTKNLYEIVEIKTLDLDARVQEAVRMIQNIEECDV